MAENASEKARKLFSMALDQDGKPEGEIAAVMFVRELKRCGYTPESLFIGEPPRQSRAKAAPKDSPSGLSDEALHHMKFPFGKHKGKYIWDVAESDDRGYLEWFSQNVEARDPRLNLAVSEILKRVPDPNHYDGDINLDD